MVFDLWYPGNAAMTSSGDPSPARLPSALPSCNTTTLGRAFQPLCVSPPLLSCGNLPRNSALQTAGSDPSCVCSNNERKKEWNEVLPDAIWVPWIFPSTLSCSREREGGEGRVFFSSREKTFHPFRSSLSTNPVDNSTLDRYYCFSPFSLFRLQRSLLSVSTSDFDATLERFCNSVGVGRSMYSPLLSRVREHFLLSFSP